MLAGPSCLSYLGGDRNKIPKGKMHLCGTSVTPSLDPQAGALSLLLQPRVVDSQLTHVLQEAATPPTSGFFSLSSTYLPFQHPGDVLMCDTRSLLEQNSASLLKETGNSHLVIHSLTEACLEGDSLPSKDRTSVIHQILETGSFCLLSFKGWALYSREKKTS